METVHWFVGPFYGLHMGDLWVMLLPPASLSSWGNSERIQQYRQRKDWRSSPSFNLCCAIHSEFESGVFLNLENCFRILILKEPRMPLFMGIIHGDLGLIKMLILKFKKDCRTKSILFLGANCFNNIYGNRYFKIVFYQRWDTNF